MKHEHVICDHLCAACPPCIHGKPHHPGSVATVGECPHLEDDTMRVCSEGPCCTRVGVVARCVEALVAT